MWKDIVRRRQHRIEKIHGRSQIFLVGLRLQAQFSRRA
jgi:hypothetical protein